MNNVLDIQEKILEIINSTIEDEKIQPNQADEDLSLIGMDSTKFIKIVVTLEETFEIEVPDEKLLMTEMGTLNKMIGVVSTALGIANE
jgi:acyl carrier protein